MKAVIDASVGLPLVHGQDVSLGVGRWLGRWIAAGSGLVVPAHFWLEIVNSLARRHRYRGEAILEAVAELRMLDLETIELDEAALVLVIDATERHVLSAYDAQYLALAMQLDIPLVTLDRSLAFAAGPRALDPLADAGVAEAGAPYGRREGSRASWPDYAGAASYLASIRARQAGTAGPLGRASAR